MDSNARVGIVQLESLPGKYVLADSRQIARYFNFHTSHSVRGPFAIQKCIRCTGNRHQPRFPRMISAIIIRTPYRASRAGRSVGGRTRVGVGQKVDINASISSMGICRSKV